MLNGIAEKVPRDIEIPHRDGVERLQRKGRVAKCVNTHTPARHYYRLGSR